MKNYIWGISLILLSISAGIAQAQCRQINFNTFICPIGGGSGANLGAFMPPEAPGNSQSTSFSPSAYKEMVCAQSYGSAKNTLGDCTKKANNKLVADYKDCPMDSEVVTSIPGFIEVKTTPNATCTKLADIVHSTTISNCNIDFENRKVPDGCNSDGTVKK